MKYLVSRPGQTISQDIVFSMSLIRKEQALFHEKLAFHALVGFVQVKRQNFTVTSATKSSAVVFGAHCKRKDCLLIICVCIIYNLLLLLKTHVTLHISLVVRQQARIVPATADTEALAAYTSCDRLECYRYRYLAARVSCLLTARNSTLLCCQIPI